MACHKLLSSVTRWHWYYPVSDTVRSRHYHSLKWAAKTMLDLIGPAILRDSLAATVETEVAAAELTVWQSVSEDFCDIHNGLMS